MKRVKLKHAFAFICAALAVNPSCSSHDEDKPALDASELNLLLIGQGVTSMDLEGPDLYWASYESCAGGEFPNACWVRAVPSTSDASRWDNIFINRGTGSDRNDDLYSNVVADEVASYWVDVGGEVIRHPRHTTTFEVLAEKADASTMGEIAEDASYVYWTENDGAFNGKLFRVPKTGGSRELMFENDRDSLRQLRTDGTGSALFVTDSFAFLCCEDVLFRLTPAADGTFQDDFVDIAGVESYAVRDGQAYFVARFGPSGAELRSTPLGDLSDDTLLLELDETSSPVWPALAATDSALYFQELRGSTGPIFRLPFGSGAAQLITDPIQFAQRMLASEEHLFVQSGPKIYRYELDEAERRLDLVGDDVTLEVVQALQNVAHDVPLVAGKQTVVRVYARIGETTGSASLDVWPLAELRGWRNGLPLPGSPLPPDVRQPLVSSAGVDRTNLVTTLIFTLPESWTYGDVVFESRINPNHSRPELDFGNNSSSRVVTFQTVKGICLDVVPVLTQAGVSQSTPTGIQSHFGRALSMYPTHRFAGLFRGGTPRTIPGPDDPYNMRDSDHVNLLMMNMSTEFFFASNPTDCGDAVYIRAAIVPNAARFGMSWGTAGVIYTLESHFGAPANFPDGGVKGLAHEVGHQLEMAHVNCGGPGWPFESLPYASQCTIEDSNDHVGYDVISGLLVVPFAGGGTAPVADFMSYSGSLLWSSDHTYRKIFSQLVTGAAATAITSASPDESDESAALITGLLTSGGAMMGFAYQASGSTLSAVRAKIADSTEPSASHEIRVFADNGDLLSAAPLDVGELTDAGDGPTALFHYALEAQTAARLEVVEQASGVTLATRSAGVTPPELVITSPVAGEMVGDTLSIAWNASDADGDPLAYLLRYSADAGATWQPLATGLTGSGFEVDMSHMPGSDQALLEVIASDGLHSTVRMAGPFSTRLHAPEAAILGQDYSELAPGDVVTRRQSETLLLRGQAFDPEDGDLVGGALEWHLDGPLSQTAEGTRWLASALPPGDYQVGLEATDSDGQAGQMEVALSILPKSVAEASGPLLDGRCDDAAYSSDDDPMTLRTADGASYEVRMFRNGELVYACLDGLPVTGDGASAVLRLDADASGGDAPSPGDREFRITDAGLVETYQFDADGAAVVDAAPVGTRAAVHFVGAESASIELELVGAELGGFQSLVRMHVGVEFEGDAALQAAWPAGTLVNVPDTWGLVRLGGGAPPVVQTPASISGDEGASLSLSGSVTDADSEVVSTTWSLEPGAPCVVDDPEALATTVTCFDDGVFELTLTASDGDLEASSTTQLIIQNLAPSVDPHFGCDSAIEVGTTVSSEASFTDAGSNDTHECSVDWGDGESDVDADASSPCGFEHSYERPGFYTIALTVTDDDGGSSTEWHDVVVFDPSAGSLTGGGWFESEGDVPDDLSATGKAHFEFESRYRRGASTPGGKFSFRLNCKELDFRSRRQDWLVVIGNEAFVMGTGELNGHSGYGFLIAVVDGDRGDDETDRLRVQLWDDDGNIVFDNQPGAEMDASASSPVDHGSIQLHSSR